MKPKMPRIPGLIVLVALLTAGTVTAKSPAVSKAPAAPPAPAAGRLATAVFAGGCFWSMESAFEGKPGVQDVVSGYTGGRQPNPTYDQVSTGKSGHYEAVQVTYDPRVTSFAKLLDIYWHNIDPMQTDGQFFDRAPEYETVIFTANEGEKKIAEASRRAVGEQLRKPIATKILTSSAFYPAEDYHQNYYRTRAAHYQRYRIGSGRDMRLKQIWGKAPEIAH